MNSRVISRCLLAGVFLAVCFTTSTSWSIELQPTVFDQGIQQVRFETGLTSDNSDIWLAATDQEEEPQFEEEAQWETKALDYKQKSPLKAFFMSLAVPGLGQFYYGSKIKPVAFLGIEAVSWMMNSKWNGDGDDLTSAYEAYNLAHWSRDNYGSYLFDVWGDSSDTDINDVTHHLPETNTQQYFEMTGKYDQFGWGWDDAEIGGRDLNSHISVGDLEKITDDSTTIPSSENRFTYEQMRDNANKKYDKADRMIYVVMFNHLVSAFEAYITTNKHNSALKNAENEFAVQVRASLRTSYVKWDTPFMKVTYKF